MLLLMLLNLSCKSLLIIAALQSGMLHFGFLQMFSSRKLRW